MEGTGRDLAAFQEPAKAKYSVLLKKGRHRIRIGFLH